MKSKRKLIAVAALAFLGCLSSCGPVNLLTRARKVPRNYTVNYNYEHVKSERTELNKKPWVVYSDREGNVATMEPGGSLPQQELAFREPMLVIGRKGDYYKLIKYDPDVLKNLRLVKYKEAEYYGWIHKDLLLLFNNSLTEIRNGIKLKSLTAMTDCRMILEAEEHFANDSIRVYSEPKLETPCGSLAPGNIVYVLKTAEKDSRVLVARKTVVTPGEAGEQVAGWIDASLIVPFGQRLTLNQAPSIPEMPLVPDSTVTGRWRPAHPPVSLSPMLYHYRTDTTLLFRTLDATELLDHSDNRIYNVNGEPITLGRSREIASQLKEVNVIFSFAPSANVIWQLPVLCNSIQNLKPIFDASDETFRHHFAASVGGKTIPFTGNYLSFSEQLIEACKSVSPETSGHFVQTLDNALQLASGRPDATNIIVLIGDQSAPQALPDPLFNAMTRNNCRLFSYQVYADKEDTYNNFVLQSLEIIEAYAAFYRTSKQEIMVFSNQLRRENSFLEGAKNAYALDFPARSMTQGMVVFPEKGRYAEPELFMAGIDSLVRQVETDNQILMSSLDKAFAQIGRHRSRFVREITGYLGIEPDTPIDPHIGKAFRETAPRWVTVTGKLEMAMDSVSMAPMGLLLTEEELEEVKGFVEKLSSLKPDVKGEGASQGDKVKVRHVRKVRKSLRGIPADLVAWERDSTEMVQEDPAETQHYQPTRKIRRHLRKTYLHSLSNCVMEGKPQKLTLAEAQEYITTIPTLSPQLGCVSIKHLKKKSRFSDRQLDLLVEHFEEYKEKIDKQAIPVKDIATPGGETFFFLPMEAVP